QTSVTIQLQLPNGTTESCTPINNESSPYGYYNCTFDSTDHPEGNYSLQLNSSRIYFNPNSTFLQNWFWLENLNATTSQISVTPQQDGWTKQYNYSILIDDPDSDEINCSLYIDKLDGQGWIFKGMQTLYNESGIVNQTCTISVWDFTGDDIGENKFKFFIQNGEPSNYFNTTNQSGPTLEESNVTVTFITPNSTEVNITNDYELLTVLVNDTDNYTEVSWHPPNVNVTFWVHLNDSTTDSGNLTQTNQSGYANIYFNPDCNYSVGPQIWLAGVTDQYYEDQNTTNPENLTIIIRDDLITSIISPLGTEHLRGTNITIRFNVTDNCNNNITGITDINITMIHEDSGQTFSCNNTVEEGNGIYNCTFNTSGMPAQEYTIMIYTSKQYYNDDNLTVQYSGGSSGFFIETEPVLSDLMLNTSGYDGDTGPDGSWSESHNFSVRVTDEDGDAVDVNFYKRKWTGSDWGEWQFIGTDSCNGNCNNSLVFVYENPAPTSPYVPPSDLGTWQYKANCTDDSTSPIGDGSAQYGSSTTRYNYTIEKDDMIIYHYYGNGTWIWRNGSQQITLSARTFTIDQNSNKSGVNTTIWITKNHTDFEILTYKDSSAGGFVNHTFDPNGNCEYDVGIQYWKMGSRTNDEYKDTNSSVFQIELRSYLNGSFSSPNGEAYQEGQNVTITFNLFDECGHGLPNANSTEILIYSETGGLEADITSGIIDLGNGTYEYNWSTTGHTLGEYYNITVKAQKDYYTDLEMHNNLSFSLGTAPELLSPTLQSGDNWGDSWTFRVQRYDKEALPFNISLWKRKTPQDNWELLETKEITTNINTWSWEYFTSNYFDCDDVTPDGWYSQFKFNATDQWGFSAETPTVNFTIYKDNVSVQLITGDYANIYREGYGGSDSAIFSIMINDTDRSSVGVGENISTRFYITTNGINYTTYYDNTTTSDSISRYEFNPNCTYRYGPQKWIGGVYNDTC
ncbi:MAG: hypothetical protein DRQ06_06025, partial [Candidatus Hydrothermota bacterium]